MKRKLIAFYLEWFNHWLTIENFANHHEITVKEADYLINIGRKYHIEQVEIKKLER